MTDTIIFLTLFSSIISFLLVPPTIAIAKKFGLLDNPNIRPHPAHTHSGIIPRAGGLPIFLSIFLPLLFIFSLNQQLFGVFVGALLLILVGLWDDRKDRSPYVRFAINVFAALLAVGSGITIPYTTNPLGGVIQFDQWMVRIPLANFLFAINAGDILSFLWILWATNIVGWSGGVDGQLPGFVAISAIVIGILSLRIAGPEMTDGIVTSLSFLTAGAYLGFLPWNFYPQKIMPGYGGKTLAGYMLAILSVLSFSKLGTALLVLTVPITDASFMLAKRILTGHSVVRATSGHLHHHLLLMGWSRRKVAIFYWCISGIAGIAALTLTSQQKAFVAAMIFVMIAGFILWVNQLSRLPSTPTEEEF